MRRSVIQNLVGIVATVALSLTVVAQDTDPRDWPSEEQLNTGGRPLPQWLIDAYEAAGYDVSDGGGLPKFDVWQPEAHDVFGIPAEEFGGIGALYTSKKSVYRAEFSFEAFYGESRDAGDAKGVEPQFWCGLVYRDEPVVLHIADADVADEIGAAKKIAALLSAHFEDSGDKSVVVSHKGNKVYVERTGVDDGAVISGVNFGGKSSSYKVSARMLSTEAFGGNVRAFELKEDEMVTGGPLLPPPPGSKDGGVPRDTAPDGI